MLCSNCGGFNTVQVMSQNLPSGETYEEWKCNSCYSISSRISNYNGSAVAPIYVPDAKAVPKVQTRQDKINEYWDQLKKEAGKMVDLDKWMLYYYLNKMGVSIIGLDHKIEVELQKKFPEEKKKPA